MEINGMVYCMFEQSGVFKNEFKKLGINAVDMDIQNNFNETDHIIDLFNEIEKGYAEEPSIFDNITQDDLIIAFFPCIYFTGSNNPPLFNGSALHKPMVDCIPYIINRNKQRSKMYELLLMFCGIIYKRNFRMIFENPYDDSMHYLKNNFLCSPAVYDKNRMLRGDYFRKPTGFWYINCEPTYGESFQNDKEQKVVRKLPSAKGDGLCSEERSMISPDYARNLICDFILGKVQESTLQKRLF